MKHDDVETTIQKFRNGKLTADELKVVEQNISDDITWAEEYRLQKDMGKAVQNTEVARVKNILVDHESQSSKQAPRRIFIIAGIITLLFGLVYLISILNQDKGAKTVEDIYAAHWEPMENRVAPITRTTSPTPLQEAMRFYDREEYDKAYMSLSDLINEERIPEVDLYRAISLITLDRYNEAEDILKQIQFTNPSFEFEREWNLAVVPLVQGRVEESKVSLRRLEEISTLSLEQKGRISKILDDLERIKEK